VRLHSETAFGCHLPSVPVLLPGELGISFSLLIVIVLNIGFRDAIVGVLAEGVERPGSLRKERQMMRGDAWWVPTLVV
jgi:hypothetical protein